MKLWIASGKVLLAVASLAVGLTIYLVSPAARLVPFGYWGAIVLYIAAAEFAWHMAEVQSMRRPRLLADAGLRAVNRTDYRVSTKFASTGLSLGNGLLEVGGARDIERDMQPSLLSELTGGGSDNRYELIVAAPGVGKTTLLHRLGFELLQRKYPVCMLDSRLRESADISKPLRELARQAPRLFILIDDIELQAGVGGLLESVLGGDDGITIVGTCCQQAYDAMLRGPAGASVTPRDLISLGKMHHLRLTPREAQSLQDRIVSEQPTGPATGVVPRHVAAVGVTDMLALSISLRHGLRPAALALSALDELDAAQEETLCALCVTALCGRSVAPDDLAAVLDKGLVKNLPGLFDAELTLTHDGNVYGPHPAVATILLKAPDLLRDGDKLPIAEKVLRSAFEHNRLLANAIICGVFSNMDTEFATRLWETCRDAWFSAADELPNIEVVDALVPTLRVTGDHKFAADLCRRHVDDEFLGERAGFQLGLCLYHLGSYKAASEIFEHFIARSSYAEAARLNCTLTDIGRGQYDKAEAHLEILDETAPRLPGLHYLRGYLAELQGQMERAIDEYQEARAQYWYDTAALRRLAALKTTTGAIKDAIRLYEAGLQQDPEHVEYYGGLAVAHHLAGNTSRAMVQSARAIQAGIDPAAARKATAWAYMEHGLYEHALGELRNCLTYMPEDIEAQVQVARCLRNQNDLDGAREALEEAVSADPQSLVARTELVRCLRDLQDCDRASAIVEAIADTGVATPEFYVLAATVAANQGDAQLQAQKAALALEAGDESGWAWFISAQAVGEQQAADSYARAASLLSQIAVTGTPVESAAAYQAIAVCRQRLGDEKAARDAANRARKKIVGTHYNGEPIFSALLLRTVRGTEFLEQLREFGIEDSET